MAGKLAPHDKQTAWDGSGELTEYVAEISISGGTRLVVVGYSFQLSCSILIRSTTVLPTYHEDAIPSAIAAPEVTKVALRLRYLIEECVPCELEVDQITKSHSRIITHQVVKAAREAGGRENGGCVVYALLVNKRWFKKQAMLELWDADLHNVRAVACEVIAKQLCVYKFSKGGTRTDGW